MKRTLARLELKVIQIEADDIMEEPKQVIETIEDYCEFGEHRVYLLMAIARIRENPQLSSNSEVVFREVLKQEDDVRRKYQELACSVENYHDESGNPLTFRLYLTVNARNTLTTYFNFLDRLNQWSQAMIRGDDATPQKLKRIDKYWKSELQRNSSKDDTRFLFDVDTKDINLDEFQQHLTEQTEILELRETPNGYHVITEPFNHTELTYLHDHDDIEIETDRMMFLRYLTLEENSTTSSNYDLSAVTTDQRLRSLRDRILAFIDDNTVTIAAFWRTTQNFLLTVVAAFIGAYSSLALSNLPGSYTVTFTAIAPSLLRFLFFTFAALFLLRVFASTVGGLWDQWYTRNS